MKTRSERRPERIWVDVIAFPPQPSSQIPSTINCVFISIHSFRRESTKQQVLAICIDIERQRINTDHATKVQG